MTSPTHLIRVLFICTGNAGRSQLAQAVCTLRAGGTVAVESAGVEPWARLHPMAVKLMRELGVDDAAHYPKGIAAVSAQAFDLVVTIGDPARRRLPLRMKGNPYRIHWDIPDPADADGTPDSEQVFRRTLDRIEQRLPDLLAQLKPLHPPGALRNQPGINSGVWAKQVLSEDHFSIAASAGFKGMEISPYMNPNHFDFASAAQIRRIRRAAADSGLAVWSLHSRDVADLTSPDPAERQKQVDHLLLCLDAADALGATAVVSHIQVVGKHFSDLPPAEARIAEGMNRLAPRAEASCARIALENGYARKPGQWSHDMFRRANPFSPAAFGYVLDTGHANIAGDLEDIEKGIGQRLISLHLNDNAGTDIHLTGGKGTVDWARTAGLLKAAQYDGCLMWEIGVGKDDFNPQILTDTMDGHLRLMEYLAQP
jgi:sugar phosphate isomerase/epimerase/protein-tyrosine-phosphatase